MKGITKERAVEICRGFLLKNRIIAGEDEKWEPEWICKEHPTGHLSDRRNDCWFMPCPSLEPDTDRKDTILCQCWGVNKVLVCVLFRVDKYRLESQYRNTV